MAWTPEMRERYKLPHEARKANDRTRYAADPEKWWVAQIGRLGCTAELYQELFEKQRGLCAICRRQNSNKRFKRLAVDHDHVTGKIRGLLCNSCNTALGVFDDDAETLMRAVEYLNAVE